MSTVAETTPQPGTDDALARRNAIVLAAAQALAGGNGAVTFATVAILGAMLAPSSALATLPLSAYVIGQWLGALPVGALANRFGRRAAYQAGTVCGVLTGVLNCLAALQGSFLLLNVGAFFSGLYASAHQA